MKTLCILMLSFIAISSYGQTQIPEGGFDNWTGSEPTGGWWTSLNTLSTLGGPLTVSSTTDVHSGAYAAKLETKEWATILIAGILASGEFLMKAPFIKTGKPFTDKPSKFTGWFKYSPVGGDSAAVAAFLTKFNTVSGKTDTIAKASQTLKNTVTNYTQFNINFDYRITGINPDTIIFVLTSSAGSFSGQVGSTLYIDEISLQYATGLEENLMPEFTVNVSPSPASGQLLLEFNTANPEKLLCYVYAIDGRFMQSFFPSGKNHRIDVSAWQQGTYIVQAWKDGSLVSSSKFLVAH